MKLALGTAQFGLNYGVTNHTGQVSLSEIERILSLAQAVGITTIDTAAAYGDAESRLGQVLQGSEGFQIVSKVSANVAVSDVPTMVDQSLQRLTVKCLDGILVHQADDLLGDIGKQRFEQLQHLKHQGKIRHHIGASLYCVDSLQAVLTTCSLDMIQVPVNLLDQRFLSDNVQQQLMTQYDKDVQPENDAPIHRSMATNSQKKSVKSVVVHARSLFLQGVLITPIEQLPDYFQAYKKILQPIWDLAQQHNVTPMVICLTLVLGDTSIDKAIVGCCDRRQLLQIIQSYSKAKDLLEKIDFCSLQCQDERLILPTQWPVT